MNPIDTVQQEGPDWPIWTDDAGQHRISCDDVQCRPGALYMTRVEGDVYGVHWSMSSGNIYVYRYTPYRGEAQPVLIGSKDAEDRETVMRTMMREFPGYLIRWSL
jgi:hypothetical protein